MDDVHRVVRLSLNAYLEIFLKLPVDSRFVRTQERCPDAPSPNFVLYDFNARAVMFTPEKEAVNA